MCFEELVMQKAVKAAKNLVLPEALDSRILKAAKIIIEKKIAANVTLVGSRQDVLALAEKEGLDLNCEGLLIEDPALSPRLKEFVSAYLGLRKHRVMTKERAFRDMKDPLRFAAMLTRQCLTDAMVAGAVYTTADVLRAGISIVGLKEGIKTASSCFVISGFDKNIGHEGALIFSDCAVVPSPNAAELADITIAAAKSCKSILGVDCVAALLSFSTKGSALHPDVTKVRKAAAILHERDPGFLFDGELQLDAALVPSITDKKAQGSPIRGKVNTLVFPNLDAANIGYKMAQRLAGASAFGPFLQGFARPISDLSRGASVEEIVIACSIALTFG